MTYREKFFQEYPNYTEADIDYFCTWIFDQDKDANCLRYENGLAMSCADCWNREIPVDDIKVCPDSLPMIGTWTWEEASTKHWALVNGSSGVCPNCYMQDRIDPLAKYCRYCGTRLEVEE